MKVTEDAWGVYSANFHLIQATYGWPCLLETLESKLRVHGYYQINTHTAHSTQTHVCRICVDNLQRESKVAWGRLLCFIINSVWCIQTFCRHQGAQILFCDGFRSGFPTRPVMRSLWKPDSLCSSLETELLAQRGKQHTGLPRNLHS